MNGRSLVFVICTFVCILAWITYGNIEGVVGFLAFLLAGLLAVSPWLLPFGGIILGILDALGFFGIPLYEQILIFVHLQGSWMTIAYYWGLAFIFSALNLFLSFLTIIRIQMRGKEIPPTTSHLALVHCNIIDGTRDHTLITDGVILLEYEHLGAKNPTGKIKAVGSSGTVYIPEGYVQVNLRGQYVLPGLINAHSHISGSGKPRNIMQFEKDKLARLERLLDSWWGRILFARMIKKNLTNALHAGVTTIRSMGDPMFLDVKIREEIENGDFLGPNLVCSGQGINITGGHGVMFGMIADSPREVRKRVRDAIHRGVDTIKLITTSGVSDAKNAQMAGRPQMTPSEITAGCEEAHRAGLIVGAHCQSSLGINEALRSGVDTIEHGSCLTPHSISLFKDNPKSLRGYSGLIPTLSAAIPYVTLSQKTTHITTQVRDTARIVLRNAIDGLRTAHSEGIHIGVGSDASVNFCTQYNLWRELKYFLHFCKMTSNDAIYYATKGNAILLGIDDRTGSIEPGKSADLIVISDNPLENIDALENVTQVFIRGIHIRNPQVKKIKEVEKTPIPLVDYDALAS